MNPTHKQLEALAATAGEERLDLLHQFLEDGWREVAGLLILDERDRPVALAVGGLYTLGELQASPGALLHWAVILGVHRVVVFHTQLKSPSFEIEAQDHEFCERLFHLASLAGLEVVDHIVFGGRPLFASLRQWSGWEWPPPATSKEIAGWKGRYPRRPDPIMKDPVTGQSWAGAGAEPRWLEEARELGFEEEEFVVPHEPAEEWELPAEGFGVVRLVGPSVEPAIYHPPPGYRSLRHDDEHVRLPPVREAAAEIVARLVFDIPRPPSVAGAIFFDDHGEIFQAPPGIWAPLRHVVERPSALYARCLAWDAASAITFARRPGRAQPTAEDLELARRLILLGRLMGIGIRDHIIIGDGGMYRGLRHRGTWGWPGTDPLAEAWWPAPNRGLPKVVAVHPETGEIWNRRGLEPLWVQELLDQGVPFEALLHPTR